MDLLLNSNLHYCGFCWSIVKDCIMFRAVPCQRVRIIVPHDPARMVRIIVPHDLARMQVSVYLLILLVFTYHCTSWFGSRLRIIIPHDLARIYLSVYLKIWFVFILWHCTLSWICLTEFGSVLSNKALVYGPVRCRHHHDEDHVESTSYSSNTNDVNLSDLLTNLTCVMRGSTRQKHLSVRFS